MGSWRWGLDVTDREPAMDAKELFQKFCRQPGTRINAIMTRIERGESNNEIAERYKADEETIEVYRKALEGRLCDLGGADNIADLYRERDQRRSQVYSLYFEHGVSMADIAEALGISRESVKHLIKRQTGQGRKKGKR